MSAGGPFCSRPLRIEWGLGLCYSEVLIATGVVFAFAKTAQLTRQICPTQAKERLEWATRQDLGSTLYYAFNCFCCPVEGTHVLDFQTTMTGQDNIPKPTLSLLLDQLGGL
jgi:hypothetical protein